MHPFKSKLLASTVVPLALVLGVGISAGAVNGIVVSKPAAAACSACPNPCNPCCAKNPCNPCAAANPCNPCAAKNPCNPCAAANPCNPCAAKPIATNPCAAKTQ